MIHFLNAARSRLIDASVNNVRLLIYIMPRLICIIDSLGLSGDCVTLAFEFPSLFVVVDVVVDVVVVFAAVVVAGVAGVAVVRFRPLGGTTVVPPLRMLQDPSRFLAVIQSSLIDSQCPHF